MIFFLSEGVSVLPPYLTMIMKNCFFMIFNDNNFLF